MLHTPLQIGGATVRNRLYRAPVLEGAGDGDDAAAAYQRQFVANAKHGVGLIIQGSSCIWPEGRTSPGMTCVDSREKTLRLAPMVSAVQAAGASIFIQLGYGGIYAIEGWHEPYAAARRGQVLAAGRSMPSQTLPHGSSAEVADPVLVATPTAASRHRCSGCRALATTRRSTERSNPRVPRADPGSAPVSGAPGSL